MSREVAGVKYLNTGFITWTFLNIRKFSAIWWQSVQGCKNYNCI